MFSDVHIKGNINNCYRKKKRKKKKMMSHDDYEFRSIQPGEVKSEEICI